MAKAQPQDVPPRRGRPRLTAEDLHGRIAGYCKRYGVSVNDEGLPPFPGGKRETSQHREWMALYKAHRRHSAREAGGHPADLARRQELLSDQRGRCAVCRKPLELAESRLDAQEAQGRDPVVLHSTCLELVSLARSLGVEALERAKGRL
jgi:hypothetical protein